MFFYNEPDIVTQDPYFYNTSLLLNMDSDFSDSSVYQNSVTTSGNATVSTTESKFGGGSGYFDGATNTEVSCASADQFDLRGTDWTIEAWVNPNGDYNDWRMIVTKRAEGPTENYQIYLNKYDGFLGFFVRDGVSILSTSTLTTNQWNHVAAVRHNNTISLYLNGQIVGSQAGDVNHTNVPVSIGSITNSEHHKFIGHIDDVRITKGVARYTTNFTPPTQAHPTTGPSEIVSTDLQLHLDAGDTNSYPGTGTTWYDLSGNDNDATLVNGPTYSSDNGGIISLDGVDDYVIVGTNGTVPPEITISMWIKFPTLETSFFYTNDNSVSNPEIRLSTNSGFFNYRLYDAGAYFCNQDGNISITTNTWYNLVLVIRDSYLKSYVNLEEDISKTGFTYNGHSTQNSTNHTLGTQYVNGYGHSGYNNCTYSNLMVYNRVLSFEEIQQNFNAAKDRFGL